MLHVAIKKEYTKIVDYLLSTSSNWNYKNRSNLTPYDLAKNNANILRIFNKYNIDLKDFNMIIDDIRQSHLKRQRNSDVALDNIENVLDEDEFSKKIKLNPGPLYDFPLYHKSGGLKHSLHGAIYQLKLHMLMLNRALRKGYNFRLATEMDDAEKFDDLVFIYENDDHNNLIKYRFLQAKHKQDETTKITSNDLLTENNDGEFGLPKYFTSFRKILRNNEIKGEIVNLILCTNISFDENDLADKGFCLLPVHEEDELLDAQSTKCGQKFKFDVRNSPISNRISELLRCTSDLYVLAKELHNHAAGSKDLNLRIPIIKYYHGALISDGVLDLVKEKDTSKKRTILRNYAVFNKDFINGKNLQGNANLLRELFINNFESNENTFKTNYSNYRLCVSANFGSVFKIVEDPQITDCEAFANKLFESIEKANITDVAILARETGANGIIKDNLNKIAGHILIKLNEDVIINNDFLEQDILPGNLLNLREELSKLFLANNRNLTDIKRFKFKIYNFQTCEKDNIDAKQKIPDDVITDNEIEFFFEKLIFAVNQPNEIELEDIIKTEIGNDVKFNMLNVDLISDSFQKELLDWFKEKGCIKGKEGRFLSTENAIKLFNDIDEKINTIIGIGLSLNYPKQLASFNINFQHNNEEICKFLQTNNEQILIIQCDDVFLTSLKINQLLNERPPKQDNIIFTNIDMALKLKDYIIKAFKSDKSHNILVISCDLSEGHLTLWKLCEELLPIVNGNKNKKLILATKLIERINIIGDNKLLINDTYKFNDFSLETIRLLENKLVFYQGDKVQIGIISKNLKHILDIETLVKLINDEKITIGKQLEGLREIGEYYVERKYSHSPTTNLNYLQTNDRATIILSGIKYEHLQSLNVNKEILLYETAIQIQNIRDDVIILIDDSDVEEKYNKLLNLISNVNNVYWFKYDLNKLILQRSKGLASNSSEYFNETNKTFNEIEMLNKDGIIILSNLAGMGKSTSTICLSNKLKYTNPSMWVIRINLNRCTDALEEELYYREKNLPRLKVNDMNLAINFLINHLIPNEFSSVFDKRLFELLIKEDKKVAIYFDAFDEISPNYERIVIDLVETLWQTKIQVIFITTRPTSEDVLQKKFNSLAYNLETLTTEEQIGFIKRKWLNKLKQLRNLTLNGKIIYNYVKTLITHITDTINDKDKKLTGIPLTSSMIADVYFDKFLTCYQNDENDWNLTDKFDIVELYEKFIYNKFLIYNRDKKIEKSSNLSVKYDNKSLYKEFLTMHQHAALYAMLKKTKLCSLLSEEQRKEIMTFINNVQSGIERTGIITQIIDNKPIFLHTTFAEYFAALFLIEQLQSNWKDEEMLLIKILLQPEYQVMRLFFNGLLEKDENTKLNISDKWDHKITVRCNDHNENLLHIACKEDNDGVIKFLLNVIKESTLSKLINVRVSGGNTCLLYATKIRNFKMVKLLLEHGADPNVCDFDGFTPLHVSAKLNQEEISKLLLLHKGKVNMVDHKDRTPLHYAAKHGYINLLKILANNETKVLYVRSLDDELVIDIAARYERWNIVEWHLDNIAYNHEYASSKETNVFHLAAKFGKINVVKRLLEKAHDVYSSQIKTAIVRACANNQLDTVKYLISLLTPPYEYGEKYLRVAAFNQHKDIVAYLLSLNIRLDFKDNWHNDDDVYHDLVKDGRLDILEMLLIDEESFDEKDDYHLTIAFHAADKERWDILNWLICEKNIDVNQEYVYNKLPLLNWVVDTKNVNVEVVRNLLQRGATLIESDRSETALTIAIKNGHSHIVELIKDHFKIE